MKKLLAISLSLAMLLMTVACGSNNAGEPSSSEGSSYEDVLNPDVNTEESTEESDTEEPQEPAEEDKDSNASAENTNTATPPASKPSNSNNNNTSKPSTEKPSEKPSGGNNSGSNNGGSSKPDTGSNYSGTLPDLINAIYEKQPVEIMVNDPTAVDLSDSNAVSNYLGLTDASNVKEAYYSEAMIGSQAYSLVVVRTKSASDAPSVAQSMFDGINQSKWVCVTADALAVGAYGDTVMLAMVDSGMGATLHTDLRSAYASAVGGKLDVSLDRVGTK